MMQLGVPSNDPDFEYHDILCKKNLGQNQYHNNKLYSPLQNNFRAWCHFNPFAPE